MSIRRERKLKGWTQTVLGYHAGLAMSEISKIETGWQRPSTARLERIARALGVPVEKLTRRRPKIQVEAVEEGSHDQETLA